MAGQWRTLSLNRASTDTAAAPSYFNRKQTDPSAMMQASDGGRYRCSWIEDGLTLQSDGNVTCGLDDPYSRRSFGNIGRQPLAEIWANPEYLKLQEKMWRGHQCVECNLAQSVEDRGAEPMPARPERPTTLVVETTVRCNLRCPQQACIPNNDRAVRTRDADFLELDTFKTLTEDLAGKLKHVFFFNYGDPFVHTQADQMLAHLHRTSPNAHVRTSTNGIPLSNLDRTRKVVAARALDFMMFTISGVTQEAYGRYHVGGRLDLAMRGMANVLQAKRELGLDKPIVHWRYLVFNWNDSEAEIEAALRLAEDYGVDEFGLHLTHVPQEAMSHRFAPGSPNFVRYRKYINNALGYTRHITIPDDDGFYERENSAFGLARWTSWQARKTLPVKRNRARIAVSTHRPAADGRARYAFIRTPWQTIKVRLKPGAWRCITLTIPAATPLDKLDVEIVSFHPWFPADDGLSDQRCLGVLIRDDDETTWISPNWLPFERITKADAARLSDFRYQAPKPLVDW